MIVVDVDDTILHWKEAYLKWMKLKGWETKPVEDNITWEMSNWFLPQKDTGYVMTPEISLTYIKEFNSYPRVLKPLEGSYETLKFLAVNCKYEIVALTSFSDDYSSIEFRQQYLDVVFKGLISKCIVLDLGTCKKETLQELNPEIFIEDNASHAKKAIDLGICTLLISTPYNQGIEEAYYFKDWKSLGEEMLIEIGERFYG